MISVVVEGDTDIPIVTVLCEAAGFEVATPIIDANGKGGHRLQAIGLCTRGGWLALARAPRS